MKQVPFYSNTADNLHCVQACFKMMIEYFMPERKLNWQELDKLTHQVAGKGTWWFPALLEIEKLGLNTKYIENFDYQRYVKEGKAYVLELYGQEAGTWYLERSNLTEVDDLIPEFLEKSTGEKRPAKIKDIDKLLADGWLVGLDLNARLLNGQSGFNSHMVLVFNKSQQNYVLHDPGLPARKARIVSPDLLQKSWAYSGENTTALVAVKA